MTKAATISANHWPGLSGVPAAVLRATGRFLLRLAEAGPRMDQVRRLNAMTEAELAAKGLTREGEVRRIFADRMYL